MTRSRFEPQLKNPVEDIKFFASHPMEQQRLKRSTDPAERALYASLRADWKNLGDGGPAETKREQLQGVRAEWNKDAQPRDRSVEEYLACNKWPQAEAEAPLPQNLDAVSYAQRELARSSYGLPTAHSVEENRQRVLDAMKVPEAKVPTQTYTVTRDMHERLGLNPNERLSIDSFNNAIVALVKLEDADKARAISAKAAAAIEAENAAKGAGGAE